MFLTRRCDTCHSTHPDSFQYVRDTPCVCSKLIQNPIHLLPYDMLERRISELEKQIIEKDRIIEVLNRNRFFITV